MHKNNITIILFILITSIKAQTWMINNCQLAKLDSPDWEINPYFGFYFWVYFKCSCYPDCANLATGDRTNCSTINNISYNRRCISMTCPQILPVKINSSFITTQDIQLCYDKYLNQYKTSVIKIMFIIFGVTTLLMAVIAFYVYGFKRNPNTGKQVWVGCCCCKKNINFEEKKPKHITTNSDQFNNSIQILMKPKPKKQSAI